MESASLLVSGGRKPQCGDTSSFLFCGGYFVCATLEKVFVSTNIIVAHIGFSGILNIDQGVYSSKASAVTAAVVNVTSKYAGETLSFLPQSHISKQRMYPIIKEPLAWNFPAVVYWSYS